MLKYKFSIVLFNSYNKAIKQIQANVQRKKCSGFNVGVQS